MMFSLSISAFKSAQYSVVSMSASIGCGIVLTKVGDIIQNDIKGQVAGMVGTAEPSRSAMRDWTSRQHIFPFDQGFHPEDLDLDSAIGTFFHLVRPPLVMIAKP